jgi:HSP20 family protein
MKWGLTRRNEESNVGIDSFRRDLTRFFDDFFSVSPTSLFETAWMPSIDVAEDDKAIHVKAEIPGIEEKDLNVSLENNMLTISGEKKEEKKEENKRYMVSERRFGSFHRSIALPDGVKSDGISASFTNGVLRVEIPKAESVKPKKIKINLQ